MVCGAPMRRSAWACVWVGLLLCRAAAVDVQKPTGRRLQRPVVDDLLMCKVATTREQCELRPATAGIKQPNASTGCVWSKLRREGDRKPQCHRLDNCHATGNCTHTLVFYNRVPKTGSTSLWHAIADAAAASSGGDKFFWYGHRYKDNDKVQHGLMNEDRLSSTGLRRFCKYVDELGSRANGAIALHTAYIDFDLYCPNRGIHPQYINLVRDPIDRLISGTKYVMSCVCKQHQRAEHQADGAPAGKVWCSKHTQEMTQHGADPCNSTVNDVLANRLLDGHGKAKPEGADVTLYRGYFCGHWNKCQNSADPLERVRLAKHVLSTAYSWVGILEAPTLSMQVLRTAVPMLKGIHELFHVAHKGDLHAQTNATGVATSGKEHHKKVHSYGVLNSTVLAAAKAQTADDYEIYWHAIELLKGKMPADASDEIKNELKVLEESRQRVMSL